MTALTIPHAEMAEIARVGNRSVTCNESLWWQDAVDCGLEMPRQADQPQCGYYRTRAVKGGPWVAAAIWAERMSEDEPWRMFASIGNYPHGMGFTVDPLMIWTRCDPISVTDWLALHIENTEGDLREWAQGMNLAATGMGPKS
jgi:hypothetical protein